MSKNKRVRYGEDFKLKVLAAYIKHEQLSKVTEMFGISMCTAWRWVNKAGISRGHKSRYYSSKTKERAVELYKSGLSTREVAKEVGADWGAIATWIRKAGATRTRRDAAPHGEKNHMWKGGKIRQSKHLDSAEYREWRGNIFKRDKWTCQQCYDVGGILNAHHILGWTKYPSMRFVEKNGITLCKKCHVELHGLIKRSKAI